MAYEQKDGQGSLFKNEDKQKDTHPDYRGSLTIGGQAYWLDGWKKQSQAGKAWLSLAAKPKVPKEAAPQKQVEFDDDIPF